MPLLCKTMLVMGLCIVDYKVEKLESYHVSLPRVTETYDGTKIDVSRFYKTKHISAFANGYVDLNTYTRVGIGLDTGFQAKKIRRNPTLNVSIQQLVGLSESSGLALSLSGTFGGDVKHRPCVDKYNREYYCGSMTAWSDFKEPKTSRPYSAYITYFKRF